MGRKALPPSGRCVEMASELLAEKGFPDALKDM